MERYKVKKLFIGILLVTLGSCFQMEAAFRGVNKRIEQARPEARQARSEARRQRSYEDMRGRNRGTGSGVSVYGDPDAQSLIGGTDEKQPRRSRLDRIQDVFNNYENNDSVKAEKAISDIEAIVDGQGLIGKIKGGKVLNQKAEELKIKIKEIEETRKAKAEELNQKNEKIREEEIQKQKEKQEEFDNRNKRVQEGSATVEDFKKLLESNIKNTGDLDLGNIYSFDEDQVKALVEQIKTPEQRAFFDEAFFQLKTEYKDKKGPYGASEAIQNITLVEDALKEMKISDVASQMNQTVKDSTEQGKADETNADDADLADAGFGAVRGQTIVEPDGVEPTRTGNDNTPLAQEPVFGGTNLDGTGEEPEAFHEPVEDSGDEPFDQGTNGADGVGGEF
jgi:hypothetical protein